MGLPQQETPALMRSPDLAHSAASLATPRCAQDERRRVRIRPQFALFLSCINDHERKNWLFAGSERGGRAAAVAFSLIETARLNGVEPYAYLRDVLQRINGHRQDRLEELLPMNWRPA